MNKKNPDSKDNAPPQERSFSVALDQVAKLLRTEIKLKDRVTKGPAPSSSINNSVIQVARLLRSQVNSLKPIKKRSWKKSK